MIRAEHVLFLGALGALLGIAACDSGGATTTDPCPKGICGSGGDTGSGAGGPGGAGAGGTGQGGTPTTTGTAGCVEAWSCTPWETNGADNNGTRTCTDANGCGTVNNKPAEMATLPALDLEYYKCNIEPIFNRGCSQLGCHGTEQGRAFRTYARGRLRVTGETWTEPGCSNPGSQFASEKCIGSIECGCWTLPHSAKEWQRNYDAARGFGLDAAGDPIPAGMVDSSELIAQPIAGGKAHAGVHLFKSGDADHVKLQQWLSGATLGVACITDN